MTNDPFNLRPTVPDPRQARLALDGLGSNISEHRATIRAHLSENEKALYRGQSDLRDLYEQRVPDPRDVLKKHEEQEERIRVIEELQRLDQEFEVLEKKLDARYAALIDREG